MDAQLAATMSKNLTIYSERLVREGGEDTARQLNKIQQLLVLLAHKRAAFSETKTSSPLSLPQQHQQQSQLQIQPTLQQQQQQQQYQLQLQHQKHQLQQPTLLVKNSTTPSFKKKSKLDPNSNPNPNPNPNSKSKLKLRAASDAIPDSDDLPLRKKLKSLHKPEPARIDDVMGVAGVDLRAESEFIVSSASRHSLPAPSPLSFDQNLFLDPSALLARLNHSRPAISSVSQDSLLLLSSCLKFKLRQLLRLMLDASHHRSNSSYLPRSLSLSLSNSSLNLNLNSQPNLKSFLSSLERSDFARQKLLSSSHLPSADSDPNSSKLSAKPAPDLLRSKLTNQTALMSAGGLTKSWMLASSSSDLSSSLPPLNSAPIPSSSSLSSSSSSTTLLKPPPRPSVSTISLKDALFVLQLLSDDNSNCEFSPFLSNSLIIKNAVNLPP
ncbi:hypothetical protein AX774_g8058 [Zancudomyces culisetae]|uniref:Transcription initiation factor TFIID subunit 4 n=1 Tax=Zancudomyces culisetae TaxID=1213189 RepID=A0A1R1PCA0_ZANCU|nr:hypothetical protein AX774_g8058 [Zancudomyces culisetae]|eukprot:OMH78549.1 hypothetical protein AX774_g8058 [Zancudomyces culisetae]